MTRNARDAGDEHNSTNESASSTSPRRAPKIAASPDSDAERRVLKWIAVAVVLIATRLFFWWRYGGGPFS
jgi:hypothetical protein